MLEHEAECWLSIQKDLGRAPNTLLSAADLPEDRFQNYHRPLHELSAAGCLTREGGGTSRTRAARQRA